MTADMPEPRWHGDHEEWKRIPESLAKHDVTDWLEQQIREHPIPELAWNIAFAVFYTAAGYNTLFRAPNRYQLHAWGSIFDKEWLTVDLAVAAVHEHFAESTDGHMVPGHVLHKAAILKLTDDDPGSR